MQSWSRIILITSKDHACSFCCRILKEDLYMSCGAFQEAPCHPLSWSRPIDPTLPSGQQIS